MMPLSGVRSSWLMVERNSSLRAVFFRGEGGIIRRGSGVSCKCRSCDIVDYRKSIFHESNALE